MRHWIVPVLFLAWVGVPLPAHAQSYYRPQVSLPPSNASLTRTLLEGVSWRRRAEAAELLGQSGDPRVLEALATAAKHDTQPEVRATARDAIRQIRGTAQQVQSVVPGPFPQPQPQDPNVTLVDSWYQRYLGRSAGQAGIATWAGALARGASAIDVQAGILGSDEFWQLNGSSAAGFIQGMYVGVLGRNPNRADLLSWGQRYAVNRGNRGAVAREFVEAAQTELLRRGQGGPINGW